MYILKKLTFDSSLTITRCLKSFTPTLKAHSSVLKFYLALVIFGSLLPNIIVKAIARQSVLLLAMVMQFFKKIVASPAPALKISYVATLVQEMQQQQLRKMIMKIQQNS